MSPILIRCTVHRDLSHDAFSDWLDRRRPQLTGGTGGVRHVNAGRLGTATWVLELHGNRADDPELRRAVEHLLADLSLLGMRPALYEPRPMTPSAEVSDLRGRADAEAMSAPYAGSL